MYSILYKPSVSEVMDWQNTGIKCEYINVRLRWTERIHIKHRQSVLLYLVVVFLQNIIIITWMGTERLEGIKYETQPWPSVSF